MIDASHESHAAGKALPSNPTRGFDGIAPEVNLTVDGIDDAVLSDLFDRIHVDVILRDGPRERVASQVPVHIGHTTPDVVADASTEDTGRQPERYEHEGIATKRAIVALTSNIPESEGLFRITVVTLDATPGNQVEGISPLYHVSGVDGPDRLSAVLELSTRLEPETLTGMLSSIEMSHEGVVHLRLVDMEGVTRDTETCTVPWPAARTSAAVLAPWFDMDPEAVHDGQPVSFLLAMAPDAGRVGMVSDHWIIGETQ